MDQERPKRKRDGDRNDTAGQEANATAAGQDQDDDVNDDATFLESLVSPDFEELSSHFPNFRRAYRSVQESQAAAAAASQNKYVAHSSHDHSSNTAAKCSMAAHMTQDFSMALTRALLHLHFGITLTHLPSHHLCPPIPNRFFFVQWIQKELLPKLFFYNNDESDSSRFGSDTSSKESRCDSYFVHRMPSQRVGLDIGTGATCIYPLLFAANVQRKIKTAINGGGVLIDNDNSRSSWTLYGTDTDPDSIQLAESNVQSNMHSFSSTNTIHSLLVDPSDNQQKNKAAMVHSLSTAASSWESHSIGPLRRFFQTKMQHKLKETDGIHESNTNIADHHLHLDFCMTNPPFYDDNDNNGERTNPRKGDGRARTSMTVSEGSYPGGEVGFVVDIILDGLVLYACHDEDSTRPQQQQQQHHQQLSPPQPPGWSCCMCGKKASWIRLQHIVTQLLGPGHVMATEFGPGHLTRWFLAWTFHQPQIRSPLARVDNAPSQVVVHVAVPPSDSSSASTAMSDEGSSPKEIYACREVMNRLDEYCRDLPGWDLTLSQRSQTRAEIREATPVSKWIDDGLLPDSIRNVLAHMDPAKRMNLLPPEGHFLIDIELSSGLNSPHGHVEGDVQVVVQVTAFQHSTHGLKTCEKIISQLEGELCRTNRRWRRKLKRQQEQSGQPSSARQDTSHPMDES